MRFILALGFLALIIQCGCLPIDILSGLTWPDDNSLAAALTRVKKEAESIDYLKECTFVQSWQEQPGFINVLAFLDASWEYSHRQATMLKTLQGRLEKSGITGIKFFVINSSEAGAIVNNLDVEDEKEAWDAAEPTQTQAFSEIQQTREALKSKIDPDITFVQDSNELKIWEKLSASRDQVIVIDRCGRLSYRVIVPWSILHFPYVKAAILSTYKEQPCGACDFESTTAAQETTEAETESLSELLSKNLNFDEMKEIVAKKFNLDKTDNTVKKVYHSTKSQDIPDHVIQLLNGSAVVKQEKANLDSNNGTSHGPLLSAGDSSADNSFVNRYSQAPNSTEDLFVTEDTFNVSESTTIQIGADLTTTIINDSLDSAESTTVDSVEDEGSYSTERTDHRGQNDQEADDSESVESSSLATTSKYEEDYSVETSTLESSSVIDASSDSEILNTSESSSWEAGDNNIHKTVKASGENSEDADYVMPIRIIMHAPHIHEYEEPMKKYEYLVLKLGKPEYHGHLEEDINDEAGFESSYDNNGGETEEENDEANPESEEVGGSESERRHGHHGNGHGHKARRKQHKNKHLHSIFDKDESPGFYGEDVEYWRNFGNGDYQGTLQIEQPKPIIELDMENVKQAEVYDAVNITETVESYKSTGTAIVNEARARYQNSQTNQESSKETDGRTELVESPVDNAEEDETANRLFAHYSKLIPWLDYVFEQ